MSSLVPFRISWGVTFHWFCPSFLYFGFSRAEVRIAARRTIGVGGSDGPFVHVGAASVYRQTGRALVRGRFGSAQPIPFTPVLGALGVAVFHDVFVAPRLLKL